MDNWEIFKKKRVALYGAGGFGQAVQGVYGNAVTLWVDKSFEKYRKMNLQVDAIEELTAKQDAYDVIFVAILNANLCREIRNYLIEQGIAKEIFYFDK